MKVSDYIINFFARKNITTAFCVTGGGCMHLTDSLRKSNIETFFCHHEQSCLMAAEGYTRLSNKLCLNVVTTGPGGANTLTGLMGMWLDSIPGIVISGQVNSTQLSEFTGCRQIGDQEFDIISVVKNMTKYAKLIKNKNEIHKVLEEAYHHVTTGRPGPVWIDIPIDIQNAQIEEFYLDSEKTVFECTEEEISQFKKLLESAKKPLVIVGSGVRLSDSYTDLENFLTKNNIPVVSGPHSGVDAVDNTYDYYAGRIGILGQLSSNEIVQNCDLIIGLGTRCPVKMTGYNFDAFAPKAKKIFVDIDVNEINKHKFNVDYKIVCDLKSFLNKVNNIDFSLNIENGQNFVKRKRSKQKFYQSKHKNIQGYVSFYYFIDQCPKYLESLPMITSNGTAHVVPQQMYRLSKGQRLFTNAGCASMGYGLPASIGACIANSKKPVVCFEGDGSIMMNLQELQTVITNNLPIKLFIINNDGYLSMKMTQDSFFNKQRFGCDSHTGIDIPSFKKLADTFGYKYFYINSNRSISKKMNEIMAYDGPCIVELFCHPGEKHEPKVEAKGYDENGKIIPGLLTDMKTTEDFS